MEDHSDMAQNYSNSSLGRQQLNELRKELKNKLNAVGLPNKSVKGWRKVSTMFLYGIPIVSLRIDGQERLCLAQISNTLLKEFSYNEIHNRRVALGITCVQCTPVQLEILRRAGAMPITSRRCGMITRREAERLCKSFLGDNAPPRLPDDFAFNVQHKCAWGCRGAFLPARYNSSRAKCIKCHHCSMFFSPNKFIFHSHRLSTNDKYVQPDAANFNSWRRHMLLSGQPSQDVLYAWEDVKAMFNGGTRKRVNTCNSGTNPTNKSKITNTACVAIPSIHLTGTPLTEQHQYKSQYEETERFTLSIAESKNIKSTTSPREAHVVTPPIAGVSAIGTVTAVRPLNMRYDPKNIILDNSSYLNTTTARQIKLLPFPHSFMMDYVWQQGHVQFKGTNNEQEQEIYNSKIPTLLKNCSKIDSSLPWLKGTMYLSKTLSEGNIGSEFVSEGYHDQPHLIATNTSAFKPVKPACQQLFSQTKIDLNSNTDITSVLKSDSIKCCLFKDRLISTMKSESNLCPFPLHTNLRNKKPIIAKFMNEVNNSWRHEYEEENITKTQQEKNEENIVIDIESTENEEKLHFYGYNTETDRVENIAQISKSNRSNSFNSDIDNDDIDVVHIVDDLNL